MRGEKRRTMVCSCTKKRRHRLTGNYPQKVPAAEGRASPEQEERFRAEISFGESVRMRDVLSRHPPVCLDYKAESGCTCGDKCRFRHTEVDGQPSQKVEEKLWKRISCLTEGVCTIGLCVSRLLPSRRKIITVLTRYRPIVLEKIKNCNDCNFPRRRVFGIYLKP